MRITRDDALRIALDTLSEEEKKKAVIYWDRRSFNKDTPYFIGFEPVHMPFDYRVVFIDLAPRANWGHPCQYVFIDMNTGNSDLYKKRSPPMGGDLELLWAAKRSP